MELNPASELELPKLGQRLPKHVLSLAEAETVINLPDLTQPLGIRFSGSSLTVLVSNYVGNRM